MTTIVTELRKRVRHIHFTTGQRPSTLAITAGEFRQLRTVAEPKLVDHPDGRSYFEGVILEVQRHLEKL